jgi:transposase-like protein
MKLSVYCKQCSNDNFKRDYRTNKFVCLTCGRNHDKNQLVITGRISEKTLWAAVEILAEEDDE